MISLCLALIPAALAVSFPLTAILARLGHRLGTYDSTGVEGQIKEPPRRVPNTGGIAIFAGIALPMLAGLALLVPLGRASNLEWQEEPGLIPVALWEHLPGIAQQAPLALGLIGALAALHLLGLVDDRRPLGPWIKLVVMLGAAGAIVVFTDTRLLTALDAHVGGTWLSIALTILWIAVVTNAMNFIDNMDGLCAGVASVAGACFLAAALLSGQWFVAATLALLVGSCLGFLAFNRPPARIFMGDAGSLVIGFLLGFLTVRTTYYDADAAGGWYAVFMPLVVLAVPLYDFISVTIVRLRHGRSPFVGDLNHFSHRLVRRGLGKPAAVAVICGLTGVTGLSGIMLASLAPWQALLVGVQCAVILLVVAAFEYASARRNGNDA
ncbi:MAG: undecaprenyl/decaprenyl-phosphate alpha-N-acetylglucosaminyl 1-phosphate transferase [Leptolyngbya sp. PLA2]|nr:undecaprenyl/decaprenyl-phosphate alpha-N-acetylglucosaminyl 1-phosphate transferase [Leptolyngbya sp. PL-A2]MCQ3940120.1 undecaprenyl/decaprenyl-phosphate alpha-N-acetylglucosaminyl 1-phosphate transferase [cyanobacterium CYA1]MCZ7632758.1 undecaprenyl/decaprenyl-phosphate alpha-N-acetylglucosaminyl 1-phosphate transferase [Phycisphaerales bacterium]MDL1904143.1 undecaprenyl/decaprenyl-phosphate alpha-N-acetylglucosaminyl 1-phosphate transferase [Synechococcales cyanobacterium CNB]GIK19169.